jgi:hypothetical protein
VRQVTGRYGAAILLALGLAALTAAPAAAKDTYAFYGPLEIRIAGANGELRDFVALSTDDRRGASALVEQLVGAMQGPAQPIEGPPALPHYRIGVSHLGLTYVTTPWARMSETSFIYYPGADASSFLLVEFRQGDAALQERWIQPSSDVAALLQRHLQGMSPIETEATASTATTDSWSIAIGAVVLAVLSVLLLEDRRRRPLQSRVERRKGDVNRRS